MNEAIEIRPSTTYGHLEIVSSKRNVWGRFQFRTSDDHLSAYLLPLGDSGRQLNIHGKDGVGSLDGQSGETGFLNISVSPNGGVIHFENQISAGHKIKWIIIG